MIQFVESSTRISDQNLSQTQNYFTSFDNKPNVNKVLAMFDDFTAKNTISRSFQDTTTLRTVSEISDLALLSHVATSILTNDKSFLSQGDWNKHISRPRMPLTSRGFKSGKKWLAKKTKLNCSDTVGFSDVEQSTEIRNLWCRESDTADMHSALTPQIHPPATSQCECLTSSGSSIDPDSSLLSPPLSPELGNVSKAGYDVHAENSSRSLGLGLHNSLPPVVLPQNMSPVMEPPAATSRSFGEPPSVVQQHPSVHQHCMVQPVHVVVRKENQKPRRIMPTKTPIGCRVCISCHCDQTPCWRPSWDPYQGQLCNSCGLRYRKSRTWCSSVSCGYIPSKLELSHIKATCSTLRCPKCQAGLTSN